MAIRVCVADGRPIVRAGLVFLLEGDESLEVVGEADSGHGLLAAVAKLTPDVVILPLVLDGGGVRTIQLVRRSYSEVKVLVLADEADLSLVRSAVAAGAHGYILTTDETASLTLAISSVHRGRAWLSVEVADDLSFLIEGDVERELSSREAEVLIQMALGHTYKVISERLDISIKTIEGHRTRICHRLGFETRADLVRYCLESGLLDPRRLLNDEG